MHSPMRKPGYRHRRPGHSPMRVGRPTRLPDSAPAWWVRAVAADSARDEGDALSSARRAVDLEGFGQEWLTLAVLEERSGDIPAARVALDRARAHQPVDPVVELNAALIYGRIGSQGAADDAARRLLFVQPDIESALASGPSELRMVIARVRSTAASQLLTAGDLDSAFLVALSGEDQGLAVNLLQAVDPSDAAVKAYWATVTAAWFGDAAARNALDSAATADPTLPAMKWSWRLAARACDGIAADHWERALEIGASTHPLSPTNLGLAPAVQTRLLPSRYPGVMWRISNPGRPYVDGIWTFGLGRPACST